jgi:AraC-like DNA-binding protein
MSAVTVIWAVVLGGIVGGALVGVVFYRHNRRQMMKLTARLDGLEARWMAEARALETPVEVGGDGPTPESSDDDITPTADVLAGLTSHVQRLVASGGGADCLADQAIQVIYERLDANLSPAQMANALHVSLRTLERGLALALDCTPSQLLVAAKMREARRMLSGGRLRVADVADRLGFANPFHFSRRFKGFYGIAPSQVRTRAGTVDPEVSVQRR